MKTKVKKHRPDAAELKRAKAAVVTLFTAKANLAKARDEFRKAFEEAQDILEAWDECGLRDIDDGIGRLSELV